VKSVSRTSEFLSIRLHFQSTVLRYFVLLKSRADRCACHSTARSPVPSSHGGSPFSYAGGLNAIRVVGYRGWPRRRLHSPRAERMKVKPPSPPSAQSVQTKKKPPGDLAISP
jgi:hypothetical protein